MSTVLLCFCVLNFVCAAILFLFSWAEKDVRFALRALWNFGIGVFLLFVMAAIR